MKLSSTVSAIETVSAAHKSPRDPQAYNRSVV